MAYHNRNVSNRRTTLLTLQNQPKMIQAIMKGDIHKVKHLISNGESVNESDTEKRSYLHLAAAINADEIVKILLNAGARVDAKDKSNLTPLHRACRNNNDRVASIMKDSGADVNAKDSVNWTTPLHICAAHNAVECATVIIDKVVNIDATDKGGATALHYSAYNGSCDILTFLLKHGSLPNVFDKEDRRPLHWAATLDNNDAIRILIESGAKVNARDKYLRTPLHYASATGSICAVQSLIENGADPMTVDKEGNTALHLACVNGQDDVMDELLAACDLVINAPNFAGLTPLHFSAASYNGTACLEALTAYQGPAIDMNISEPESYGVECPSKVTKLFVNARDKNQRTPLHLAARQGHTNVIEVLLLQDNVDPNMMDKAGMTPLHHAAFFGLSGCVSMLLKSPKAESRTLHDITGRYPYFLASMAGSLECVELLFPPSCRHLLSKLDNFNRNPLHYAAAAGNAHQCLQYLLELKSEHGDPLFSVNQVDIFGRMPLHYASGADGEGRCIKLLLNAGAKLDTPDSEGYFTLNYAAAAGKLGALQNLLAYSTFAWHRVRFKLCPAHSAAFNGHTECLEVLINSGIYEDLHKSMRYAKICGHSAAYQVINYFISNNDSIYFTADEGNMSASDLSMDVLTSSFSSMNLKCSSQSNMASSPSSPLSAPSTLSPSSRRDSHGHLLLNGTKQSNEQLTNGQHSQPHVEQLNA
ncbi:Serine/threonine-protein phosphatase 6 regulatory ankyrin repeat subunit A [Halotydeus destructor]|nr:Serine/threonine-protein phosphatase 6 regulatory ankyrin repeat subunit A [Halotydeus destructor]